MVQSELQPIAWVHKGAREGVLACASFCLILSTYGRCVSERDLREVTPNSL